MFTEDEIVREISIINMDKIITLLVVITAQERVNKMAVLLFADIAVASKVAMIDDYYDVFAIMKNIPKEEVIKQEGFEGYTFTLKELLDHWNWCYSRQPLHLDRRNITEASLSEYLHRSPCFEDRGNNLFSLGVNYVDQLLHGKRNNVMNNIMEHNYGTNLMKELDLLDVLSFNDFKYIEEV